MKDKMRKGSIHAEPVCVHVRIVTYVVYVCVCVCVYIYIYVYIYRV